MAHLILAVVMLSAPLTSSGDLGYQPQSVVPGMGRAAVERLLGPPPFGYEFWGDRAAGCGTAHYRTGRIEVVHYRGDRVTRVESRPQGVAVPQPIAPKGEAVVPPVPPLKHN